MAQMQPVQQCPLTVEKQDSDFIESSVLLLEKHHQRIMEETTLTNRSHGTQKSFDVDTLRVPYNNDTINFLNNIEIVGVHRNINACNIYNNMDNFQIHDNIDTIPMYDNTDTAQIQYNNTAQIHNYLDIAQARGNINTTEIHEYIDTARIPDYNDSFQIYTDVADDSDIVISSDSEDDNLPVHFGTQARNTHTCRVCKVAFENIFFLKCHELTHSEDRPYKCSECNYAAKKKYDLKRHSIVHTGDKPFKCSFCNFSCLRSKKLESHLEFHTKVSAFKCKFCSYSVVRYQDLLYHYKSHHDDKADHEPKLSWKTIDIYKNCDVDSNTSFTHRNLNAHLNRLPENDYICYLCPEKFAQMSSLEAHLESHFQKTFQSSSKMGFLKTGTMKVQKASEEGHIKVHKSSQVGQIKVHKTSQEGEIKVHKTSQEGQIKVHKSSQVGQIKVHKTSQEGEIKVHKTSQEGQIKVHKTSQEGQIKVHKSSQVGQIKVHKTSQETQVQGHKSSQENQDKHSSNTFDPSKVKSRNKHKSTNICRPSSRQVSVMASQLQHTDRHLSSSLSKLQKRHHLKNDLQINLLSEPQHAKIRNVSHENIHTGIKKNCARSQSKTEFVNSQLQQTAIVLLKNVPVFNRNSGKLKNVTVCSVCDYSCDDSQMLIRHEAECHSSEMLRNKCDTQKTNKKSKKIHLARADHSLSCDNSVTLETSQLGEQDDKIETMRCVACHFKCKDVQVMKKHLFGCDEIMKLW